jgi:hypothetical protein
MALPPISGEVALGLLSDLYAHRVYFQPEACPIDEAEAVLAGLGEFVEVDQVGRVVS